VHFSRLFLVFTIITIAHERSITTSTHFTEKSNIVKEIVGLQLVASHIAYCSQCLSANVAL